MPRVSVIIPTYNRAVLLRRALFSVNAQTFQDFEIVVADDGSTDDTGAVCESIARVKHLRLNHSGLPAVARNAGIDAADGEFVAFLDSDDEWLPNKLECQIATFVEDSNVGLVCSDALVATAASQSTRETYHGRLTRNGPPSFDSLLDENFVIASTAVVRRSVFQRVGCFSEDPALRALEDYDLWLRIAAVSPIVYMPDTTVRYWYSDDGLSRRQSSSEHWLGILHILNRLLAWPELPETAHQAVTGRIDKCWATLCDAYVVQHQYRQFGETFARYLWRNPLAAVSYLNSGIRKMRSR